MDASRAFREEMQGRFQYTKTILRGVLSVTKLLVTSAGQVKRLRLTSPTEQHYVRPQRRYELPGFVQSKSLPSFRERYVRPTRYCNCQAPQVLALARELGAGRLSDWDYAKAAFAFAKEKMTLEIRPIQPVEYSLQVGTGTCFELITVFIALCRAAGIPARYKIFPSNMIDAWREATIDADPLVKKWYDSLGHLLLEGEGEAFVEGKWTVAHVGPTAERQAAAGIPITRFGEDSLGIWFSARPESIMRMESLPASLGIGSGILHRIAPGSMERVNVSVLEQIEQGQKTIESAGGINAYDRSARERAAGYPQGSSS